ncbi:type II secretion system F family protein [Marinobacter sediminum]|uniref:type II secretion system F family protein n=1 Tax=Marinobacter sediminum TaxID=256323 RepID=UPI00202F5904|nr:type II secretion system F family protein [Marinobacter sediminum]MCM0612010.1 type II secretion system F family protein [Marinobacter sediminum]
MFEGTMLYALTLGMVFVATVLGVGALGFWLGSGKSPVQRRLREVTEGQHHHAGEVRREGAFTVRWLAPMGGLVLPTDDWKRSRMRKQLVRCGYRSDRALHVFMALKVLLAFALPLLVLLPILLAGFHTTEREVAVLWLVTAAVLGFLAPDIYLLHREQKRRAELTEVFPDVLDLLVVCVEAGLSLDAAIQRVAREIVHTSASMSQELHLVSLEMRAGKARDEALRALSERTGMPEMQSLVSILVQAEHFGTSIARALREHAEEMREVRIQRAREKAAKLPVKMTFPIIFFIFPALFLVVLGPALVKIAAGLIGSFE